jgi:hypothetical protein
MDSPASSKREDALLELECIAQSRHPKQQTPLARFTHCPDWQKASELVLGALQAISRRRRGTRLSAPPGWLPPI